MLLNINEYVRVRLTAKGRQIRRDSFDELKRNYPGVKAEYVPPKEDADGWSEWQLWVLMREFGPHMGGGLEEPFELDIDVPDTADVPMLVEG